jgi:hypothetical protein
VKILDDNFTYHRGTQLTLHSDGLHCLWVAQSMNKIHEGTLQIQRAWNMETIAAIFEMSRDAPVQHDQNEMWSRLRKSCANMVIIVMGRHGTHDASATRLFIWYPNLFSLLPDERI